MPRRSTPERPLQEGDECIYREGRQLVRSRVKLDAGKVYWLIRADTGEKVRISKTKVQPYGIRRSTTLRPDPASQRPARVVAANPKRQPVLIGDPPEECKWWLDWVHTLPCCNCRTTDGIEAHHEGKKGVGQKVRDTLAVPLCWRCHKVLTDENVLPQPGPNPKARRTREETLIILRGQQEWLLRQAVEDLPQAARIEVLSKAVAVSRCARKEEGR